MVNLEISTSFTEESFLTNWFKKIYEKMLINTRYAGYGIYVDERLEGFIFTIDTFDAEEIIKIAISKKKRRQGLAFKLLSYLIEHQKRDQLFLEVRESNIGAINLYLKIGFEKVGIRKNYYQDKKENAIVMKKEKL